MAALARILLVEGQDDKHVVCRIVRRRGLDLNIKIDDGDNRSGYFNLRERIDTTVDASGVEAVGILADANDDVAKRWASITGRLREADLFRDASLPKHPDPAGTIIPEGPRSPRVGIWLMPDNGSPGELEDFVGRMIPPDDTVWPLAQAYIDGIPQADRKFAEGKIQRAKVHAWLAAQERPLRMGLAIHARDLDVDVPLCQSFTDWLQRLFTP